MEHQSHEVSPQGHPTALFKRFFQGSFDCSTACRGEGKRVDLVINSGHDTLLDYEAWDKLGGRLHPEPGGDETLLDITGLNYYPDNQWYTNGDLLHEQHAEYRPLSSLLLEVWQRYQRPVLIAETGAEDVMRAPWLGSLVQQVNQARVQGAKIEGISIFPVVDAPSWADDRRSPGGLFGLADANGNRTANEAYALEIRSQQIRMRKVAE